MSLEARGRWVTAMSEPKVIECWKCGSLSVEPGQILCVICLPEAAALLGERIQDWGKQVAAKVAKIHALEARVERAEAALRALDLLYDGKPGGFARQVETEDFGDVYEHAIGEFRRAYGLAAAALARDAAAGGAE